MHFSKPLSIEQHLTGDIQLCPSKSHPLNEICAHCVCLYRGLTVRRRVCGSLKACNSVSLQGVRLLEDVARWGAEKMFPTAAGAKDTAAPKPMDSFLKSCDSLSERLPPDTLSALVAIADSTRADSGIRALEAKDTAAVNGNGYASDAGSAKALQVGPALEGASIREWQPGECRDCEDSGFDGGEY